MIDTKIDSETINRIHKLRAQVGRDPLLAFVAHSLFDQLKLIQEQNLENFFALCKKTKIRYIYLGHEEFCGSEDRLYAGWPAVWHIAKSLGIRAGGNRDQCQSDDRHRLYFPDYAYGYWDIEKARKLTSVDIINHKFSHVIKQ